MKKLIILSVATLSSLMATAQTGKGSMMLGGTFNISSNNYKGTSTTGNVTVTDYEYKSSSFALMPTFGYFVADNLVVGLMAGVDNSKQVYKNPSPTVSERTYKYNTTAFRIFARKYFMPTTTFGLYAGLGVGMGPSKNETETVYNNGNATTVVKRDGSSTNIGLEGGIAFFPTPKFGLHAGLAGLGWNSSTYTTNNGGTESKETSSGINLNLNTIGFSFGMFYFFGGGAE